MTTLSQPKTLIPTHRLTWCALSQAVRLAALLIPRDDDERFVRDCIVGVAREGQGVGTERHGAGGMSGKIVYTFNPEMLIIGREIRGISQGALASMCSISAKLQAAIEEGTFQPSHWLVSNYSEFLNYPVPFFYREGKRVPKEAWSVMCKHGGAE